MAYQFIIVPDIEEGCEVDKNNIFFANSQRDIERRIADLSARHPNITLCVYKLDQLAKLKSKPVYARYQMNEKGEMLPV